MSLYHHLHHLILITIMIQGIFGCDEHCKKCSEDQCSKCLSGYALIDNACIKKERVMEASIQLCNVRNCLSCDKRGECDQCKPEYALIDKKCYSTSCVIYGECQYCNDYDCLKCSSGFQLSYGFCEESEEVSKLRMILIISIGGALVIITGIILGLCCLRHKRINATGRTIKPNMLQKRHIPSGQYVITLAKESLSRTAQGTPSSNALCECTINPTSISYDFYHSNHTPHICMEKPSSNDVTTTTSPRPSSDKMDDVANKCAICNDKKIVSFANCGCGLCSNHSSFVLNNHSESDVLKCPTHQMTIANSLIIKRDKKTKIKGNAIKQLAATQTCSICNLSPGTNSFNCGCPILLCAHCFNDNMNVFKYKKCPGCKKAYNPKSKS